MPSFFSTNGFGCPRGIGYKSITYPSQSRGSSLPKDLDCSCQVLPSRRAQLALRWVCQGMLYQRALLQQWENIRFPPWSKLVNPPPPSHHHHINTAYCVFTPTVYTLFKTSYNFISRSHPIHHLIIYTLLGTLFSPDPSLLQLIFDLPCISNAATAINTGILKRTEASSSEILYYFSCNLPTLVLSTCNNQYIRP